MLSISWNTKIIICCITLIVLIGVNSSIILFAANNDFFGILFSLLLFIIGGRPTTIKVNYVLIILLLFFEFVSFRLHTKSLHFLSIAILVCIVYYGFTRKFSYISFICILLFSTIFNKLFDHLTTEIKQSLCYYVFLTLKNFITIEKIEGVNFYINQAKISIDTACMGLSMFKTGLLTGAVLLTLEERKQKKYYSILSIILFSILVIILNIISNYFRIICLILLNCTKENALHHAVGLACFIVYQVVPMLFLIRYFKPKIKETQTSISQPNYKLLLVLSIVVFWTSFEIKNTKNDAILKNLSPEYCISEGKWINEDVFKIVKNNQLIYIKSPIHKPLICWTGDGYKIIETKKIMRNHQQIWFNKMEKDNKMYYSYWWYECGTKKYTSFVEVMFMKLIYNEPIRLINETQQVN
jgi:exosortase N